MADNVVETILVKLGLDASSYNRDTEKAIKQNDKLTKSTEDADKNVLALGKTLAKVFGGIAAFAGLKNLIDDVQKLNDELYFLEKNLGMSATTLKAWQGAAAGGGSASGMTESMKSLNMAMNDFVIMGDTSLLPYMNSLGVAMVDANGKLRDTDKVMLDLADSFSKMDREQAFSLASKMGIDEGTFNTLAQGREEMEKMIAYQKTMYKSSEQELKVSRELAKNRALLGSHWESLKMMVANALMPLFLKMSEVLLGMFDYLQKNQRTVQAVIKGIAFAIGAVLIPVMVSAAASATAMLLPFAPLIATVTALGAAFGLLYDDYKTWAEGGNSLFNWGAFRDYIDQSKISTDSLANSFKNLGKELLGSTIPTLKGYADIVRMLVSGDFKGAGALAKSMLANLGENIGNFIDDATGQARGNFGSAAGSMINTPQASLPPPSGSSTATGAAIAKLLSVDGTTRNYLLANGQKETRTGGTVAWRNNNPGNLKFEFAGSADKSVRSRRSREKALADARKRYQGVVDLDQWGNAIFETMEAGAVAKAQLLKKQHGNKTMPQMLRAYAKDDYSGKANYRAYEATINKVASERGVSLTGKTISQMTPAEFEALAAGMVKAEGVKAGNISRSGGAGAAQQSMRQGGGIPYRNAGSSVNQNKVDVKIDEIKVNTTANTIKGTMNDAMTAVNNQIFQWLPSAD